MLGKEDKMKKILMLVVCASLLLTGCGSMGGTDMKKVTPSDFISVSMGESGGMERTSDLWFGVSKGSRGEALFGFRLFVDDIEIEMANIEVDEGYVDEIVRIVNEYDMLKRGGKKLKIDAFAVDAAIPSFSLSIEGVETISLDDGYKKSEGFAAGRCEIYSLLSDLAKQFTTQYYRGFFENCTGTWTAPNEGMGEYIAFCYDNGTAACRIGEHGEQWARPAGSIDSFVYDASEGVYTLGVYFPSEEADDMGHSWDGFYAKYKIMPGNGGEELTVVSGEKPSETVYYYDADRQLTFAEGQV